MNVLSGQIRCPNKRYFYIQARNRRYARRRRDGRRQASATYRHFERAVRRPFVLITGILLLPRCHSWRKMRQRSLALLNSIKILRRRIRIVKASVLGYCLIRGDRRDMTAFLNYFKGWSWSSVHKDQLASIARATPAAMVGYSVNIVLAFIAFRNTIPSTPLAIWGSAALSLCWYVGARSLRRSCSKAGDEGQAVRSASKATLFALLLALPWSVLAAAFAGTTATDGEVILIALTWRRVAVFFCLPYRPQHSSTRGC